jgi:hypothetical protein
MPSNHAGVAAMGNLTNITAEYLRQCLDYDPRTGFFIWKVRPQKHFKDKRVYNTWNSRFSGKKAGRINKNGYEIITIDYVGYLGHRLAWLYVYGWLPKYVDHVNNDGPKHDNRLCNLRIATNSQNMMNIGRHKDNKSGFKGVSLNKKLYKWVSQISIKGKQAYLGLYDCPAAAYFAYQIAADIHHGEFARI